MNFTNSIRGHFSRVLLVAGLGLIALGLAPQAEAQTLIYKKNNTTDLSVNTNWTTTSGGGTSPTAVNATEIGIFDSTVASGNVAQVVGASMTIGGLRVLNPGAAITINGTGAVRTITLGNSGFTNGGGIDLSNALQNLSILSNISITMANAQSWVVGNATTARTLTINAAVNNSGTLLTLDGNGTIAIGGIISGAGGITIANSTLTANLSGADTYTGNTTLSAGTLTVGTSNVTLKTSTLNFTGGTIGFAALTNSTIGGLAGTKDLALASSFALTLNTGTGITDTYSGNLSGTSATVTFSGAGNQTLSGNDSYTGLTTVSAGTLVLSGNNTSATGGVTVSGGTLDINNATALGTGTLTLSGGTIDNTSGGAIVNSNNNAQAWNSNFTFTGSNALDLGTGTVTLSAARTVTVSATTLTVGGIIKGAFSLTKNGTGNLVLTNSSSNYTGATTINGGMLEVNTLAAGGSVSSIGNSTNVAGNLIINGGTLQYLGATTATDRTFTIGTNSATIDASGTGALTMNSTTAPAYSSNNVAHTLTLTGNNANANTFAAPINNDGTGLTSFVKSGTGEWVLTGNGNYTGSATLSGGTLVINTNGTTTTGALGNNATLTISGGNLDTTNANTAIATIDAQNWNSDFTFVGTGNLNLGTGAVTLGASRTVTISASTLTVGGTISGSGFSLSKSGAGNLVLTGVDSYTGGTTVSAGMLSFNGANTFTAGTVTVSGGTLNFNNASALGSNAVILTMSGGNLDATNGTIVNSHVNAQNWNSDFTFTGTNSLDLGTGAVALGASRTVTVSANTLTVGGIISGSGFSLTKDGAGTLNLTGAESYTGGTTVNTGTLNFNGTNTFTAGTVTLAGGTLDFNNASALGSNAVIFTITGGNLDATNGAITNSHVNTENWNGDFTFKGTNTLNLGTGGVTLGANRILTVSASTLTVGGVISDGGSAFSLTLNGSGTLALNGADTFSGNMNLTNNNGTLTLGNLNALQNATLNYTSNTTLTLATGTNVMGGLAGSSNIALGTNNLTLNMNTGVTDVYSGNISGTGNLTKSGLGAETLTGINTYTGGTNINAGTLSFNGANTFASGTVTLGGGTLNFNNAGALGSNAVILTITGGNLDATNGTITNSHTNAQNWNGDFTFIGTNSLNLGTGTVALGASRTVTVSANTLTVGGIISGSGFSLTKDGAGTLNLTGAESYTGGTTVNTGTLSFNGANTFTAGTVTLAGGTLDFNNASALGSNAVIFTITGGNLDATNGTITNSHVNAENWNGDFTFTGTNSLNLGTGGVTLGANRILTVSASTLTVGGVISDGGSAYSLTMNGAGTLALNGADTFSGNMNLTNNNGTLTLGNLNALQNATLNYTSNTTLNLATGTNVMGGLAGSSNIALGTNNLTLNLKTGLTDTYSGNISGTGNLTKSGLGTEVLTEASTYTGGTIVSGGILEVSGNNSLGAAGHSTSVSSGATLQLDNGFDTTGAGQTSGSSNGSLLTISGTGVGGNGALVNGNGTAEWQGNVALGAAATIGSGTTASGCITVGNNLGAATSNISLNTFDLTFVGAATTTTNVTANIIGATGNVHINTAGTVIYGMDGNGYTGTTFVDKGTLILDTTDNSVPLSPGSGNLLAINGPLVIGDSTGAANTAIVQMGATTPDSARFTISQNSTVTINQDGLFAVYGQDQTIGALTMNGGNIDTTNHNNSVLGLLGLNGNATILANANSSTISGNFLMANSAGNATTGFNVSSGGNVNGDLVVNALLSGGAMVKNGNGTMVLTSNLNSYTGTTEVQTGTLNIRAANALGATDGSATEGTTVDNGGQLQIQGSIAVANEYLTINGVGTNATTGATTTDGALLNKSGSNTWGGTINVATSADINTTASSSLYVSGNVTTAGSTTLTFNGDGTTTVSGNINGGLSVVKNGTGTLMYNGTLANTNTGSTTVNAGTLELNKTASTVALSGSSITINSGGTLLSDNSENIGNGVSMVLNGGTWTTNGASASTFTENLNTLTLSATSTLDLGANKNTVAYTNSSGTSWAGGAQLLIDNWNGLLAGAGTDEVFFGSSAGGLGGTSSTGQLGDIIFVDPVINGVATSTNFHAIILSTGEVVPFMPAPEPGTVAAGAALGALALVRELRRRKKIVASITK